MRLNLKFSVLSAALLLTGCTTDCTITQSAVCEVHHTQMNKSTVPIHYGLIRPDERARARYAASTNAFPHALEWVGGGCVVDTPKRAIIFTCTACKTARQQWEHDYDTKR